MLKRLLRRLLPNPFRRLLVRAKRKGQYRFLIVWNRGMGDIALGLYGLVLRIKEYIPNAEITFLTRSDLEEAFRLVEGVKVIIDPAMKRGEVYEPGRLPSRSEFDVVLEKPDPTYWLQDQLGRITPKLKWSRELDPIPCGKRHCIGMHVSSETGQFYGYEKNWPIEHWRELIERVTREGGYEVILFGLSPTDDFAMCNVTDLRGKTSLLEMMSLIKNRCSHLIAPDSGVLSLIYYIDESFPLKLISLWSDPRQGILKAQVASPNPQLEHIPLIREKLADLSVSEVLCHFQKISDIDHSIKIITSSEIGGNSANME
ncbi:MAG: glycosyltransferase family 9 protein [Simkaniaceae bacterium]|nr:glycosyltransferase family 9 protein [Simkaniaceae bacterium]MCF7853134.1 glycosyltransferase family 9 protein [Simkaniaceae bacterium]